MLSENTDKMLNDNVDYMRNLVERYNNIPILTAEDDTNLWAAITYHDDLFKALSLKIMTSENPQTEGLIYTNYSDEFKQEILNLNNLTLNAKDLLYKINDFLNLHHNISNDPNASISDTYYVEYKTVFYNMWLKAYLTFRSSLYKGEEIESNNKGIEILIKLLHSMLLEDKIMLLSDMCMSFPV